MFDLIGRRVVSRAIQEVDEELFLVTHGQQQAVFEPFEPQPSLISGA